MAGHSQFKNIMHRKGAQDAKRAKVFTKIIRELTVSAKSGSADPESNPRLRAAIIAARGANMPKDNVDRAIKRATGGDDSIDYTEIRYEGYGPGGVAIIVEGLTDNRNRTASDVRSAFTKLGGSMGEPGSVSFMFDHVGHIAYPASRIQSDALFELALEAGASDVQSNDEVHDIYCDMESFAAARDFLMKQLGDPLQASLMWKPKTSAPLDEDAAKTVLKLIDVLEDNDDVQNVFSNFDISDDVMAKLSQ